MIGHLMNNIRPCAAYGMTVTDPWATYSTPMSNPYGSGIRIPEQNRNPFSVQSLDQPQEFNPNGSSGPYSNLKVTQEHQNPFQRVGQQVNWDHVLDSQIAQSVGSFAAQNNGNSFTNAILDWNKKQFNPMNYLPENSNVSQQALYGMKVGGLFDDGGGVPEGPKKSTIDNNSKATLADSLAVYNNAIKVADFYRSSDYKEYKGEGGKENSQMRVTPGEGKFAFKQMDDTAQDVIRHNKMYLQYPDSRSIVGYRDESVDTQNYRKDIDSNRFYQRELANGYLNGNSPMPFFDRRIIPQNLTHFKGDGTGQSIKGDIVQAYTYDPIAVKPVSMLTPDEKALRIKKYGRNSGIEDNSTPQLVPPQVLQRLPNGQTQDTPYNKPQNISEQVLQNISGQPLNLQPKTDGDWSITNMQPGYLNQASHQFANKAQWQAFIDAQREAGNIANSTNYGANSGTASFNKLKEGGIHIKPENKGKFTAFKKRTGETTEEALHSDNPHVRQMANFARNAKKWKHEDGGSVDSTKVVPMNYFAFKPDDGATMTVNLNSSGHSMDALTNKPVNLYNYRSANGSQGVLTEQQLADYKSKYSFDSKTKKIVEGNNVYGNVSPFDLPSLNRFEDGGSIDPNEDILKFIMGEDTPTPQEKKGFKPKVKAKQEENPITEEDVFNFINSLKRQGPLESSMAQSIVGSYRKGGIVEGQTLEVSNEDIQRLKKLGYTIEIL